MSVSEARERNLFHRSPAPGTGKRTVVDDSAAAHIDAVVCIGETRCNEVRAQRWRFGFCQQTVVSAKRTRTLTLWFRYAIMTMRFDIHGSFPKWVLQTAGAATRSWGTKRRRLAASAVCGCS